MTFVRTLCLLLISATFAYADGNVPTIANDFVFTFFNAYVQQTPFGVLLLVLVSNNNQGTANVIVTSPYRSFNTIRVSVAPQSVLKIPIASMSIEDQFPGYNMTMDGHIVVEDKGIRLQSDLPVAVYAHAEIYKGQSADSFLVLPAVHLGTQYVAVTSTAPVSPNMIAVVAYQDNTQVTIGSQTVTINALQVASIASMNILSGTVISGNKPFAAISGCTCGHTIASDGCDYEAAMLLPVSGWGTQFVAVPFMLLSANYYQVVTNTDNTIVSAGGVTVATLNAGEYRQFQIDASIVTSNYPIQLIQLGQNTGGENSDLGDPFFVQLPSTDKMSNTSVLFQPTGFIEYDGVNLIFFLRIVTNLMGAGKIQLDGTTISALQFKRVPNSNFYYYEKLTVNTTHSVTTTVPGTQFSVISYTYGYAQGCGFICAFDLPKSNFTSGTTTIPPVTTTMSPVTTTLSPMTTTMPPTGTTSSPQFHTCQDYYARGQRTSGVYPVNINGPPINVYCDMDSTGGWTVIQSRVDDSVNFDVSYDAYRYPLGRATNPISNFWLGNENIHQLSQMYHLQLRIKLTDCDNITTVAHYMSFATDGSDKQYALHTDYITDDSDAGDGFNQMRFGFNDQGRPFSTAATYTTSGGLTGGPSANMCEPLHSGGWWFGSCVDNLNGMWYNVKPPQCVNNVYPDGIRWIRGGNFSLSRTIMEVLPTSVRLH